MIIDESRSSNKRDINLGCFMDNHNLIKDFKSFDYYWIFTNIVSFFQGLYFNELFIIGLSFVYLIETCLFLFVDDNFRKFGKSFGQSSFPSFLLVVYFLVAVGSFISIMISTWTHDFYMLYVSGAFFSYCLYKFFRLDLAEKGIG